jgi:carbamoyl-phosphate synthase small subunit
VLQHRHDRLSGSDDRSELCRQIVTFTFPHIGNVGTNAEDMESHGVPGAVGCVVREDVTAPPISAPRARSSAGWKRKGKIGIRDRHPRADPPHPPVGAPNAVIAHNPKAVRPPALLEKARAWPGLEGLDLASIVSRKAGEWEGSLWHLGEGYTLPEPGNRPHVVAMDFGAKDNIFRNLVAAGADVTVVPAETTLERSSRSSPPGCSCRTGRAIRRRPAPMPCR